MTQSIFEDQRKFMLVSGQDVDKYNENQYNLYYNLIQEEVQELTDAFNADDKVEVLDAILDIIVVATGMAYSAGFDIEGGWDEVIRSNMSKVDPETGKVLKRDDGKVLKPSSFSSPDLNPFIVR